MTRVLALVVLAAACSSGKERARQAIEFRQSRDSLVRTGVVKSLQLSTAVGRLIYDPPASLARDSVTGTGRSRPR